MQQSLHSMRLLDIACSTCTKREKEFGLVGILTKPDRDMTVKIFQIGVQPAFQSCLISIGSMSVQRLINSFGTSVMAGYTAAAKIDSIAIQVITSLGSALLFSQVRILEIANLSVSGKVCTALFL